MQITSTRKTIAVAVVFVALSGLSSIGNANLQNVSVESIKVSYADLNMRQQGDQEALYDRLRDAAEEVCGEVEIRAVAEVKQQRDCFKAALDSAIEQVGSRELSAMHES